MSSQNTNSMFTTTNGYNIIIDTDSYKAGHPSMYGRKVFRDGKRMKLTGMYDYLGPRKGGDYDELVVGGTIFVAKILETTRVTKEMVDEAEVFFADHLGPGVWDRTMWDIVVNKHEGRLPLLFTPLPEAKFVPAGTPMAVLESTDPECATLVSHLEGMIQSYIWYWSTVATRSLHFNKMITAYWKKYVDPAKYEALKGFFHHDFARRAATGAEAAFIAGCAHLYFSMGTDTCGAAQWMRKNMGEPDGKGGFLMPGFSVRATEHSVMTQRGREGEMNVFDDIYDSLPDKCIFSCVNDGFLAWAHVNAISSGARKDKILSKNIKVVTRNDSDLVVEFTKDSEGRNVLTPQLAELFTSTYEYKDKNGDMVMKHIFPVDVRRAIQSILFQAPATSQEQEGAKPVTFKLTTEQTVLTYLSILRKNLVGHITKNIAELDVLPAQYGMMCGDGLNPDKIGRILQAMVEDGWSPCNMVFGTGGKLYQHGISRDTGNFAMKASQLTWRVELEDGTTYTETKEICKETVGKESTKGRLMVYELDGKVLTAPEGSVDAPNLLQPLVRDGRLLRPVPHIGQIRQFIGEQRAARGF